MNGLPMVSIGRLTEKSLSYVVLTLGSGITLMPSVCVYIGIWRTVLTMILVGFMTFLSTFFLSYASIKVKESTDEEEQKKLDLSYEGMGEKISSNVKAFIQIVIVLSCISISLVFVDKFMVILTSLLMKIKYLSKFGMFKLRRFVSLPLACALYLLFIKEDLSSLSIFSHISMVSALLFAASMVFFFFKAPKLDPASLNVAKPNYSGSLGIIVFALHNQTSFPDLNMSFPELDLHFAMLVSLFGSLLGASLYLIVAYCGFSSFGLDIQDFSFIDIFMNNKGAEVYGKIMNMGGIASYIPNVICCLFLMIFFAGIAFNMFPFIRISRTFLQSAFKMKVLPQRKYMAMLSAIIVFIFGYFKIDADLFLPLIGALLTSLLSFVFPSLFAYKFTPKNNSIKLAAKILGVISIIVTIVTSGIEVVNLYKKLTDPKAK